MEGAGLPQEEGHGGAGEAGARHDGGTEAQQTPGTEGMAAPAHSPLQPSAGSMQSICKSNLKGASALSKSIHLPITTNVHAFASNYVRER